ncbi:MAG: hypothetical protein Q8N09_06045 [Thermodesulfovibrionia bacterium]|nr:hypothetical protein [Thermodesulfovibrionia bacterium]
MKTISKIFVALLVFFWMPGIKQAQAAHTFDTNLRFTGATSPLTSNYTAGAGATVLVLGIVTAGATDRAGGAPTYNGVALTQADITRKYATSPETSSELWYLINPPTGSAYSISVPNVFALTLRVQASTYKAQSGYTSALDVSGGNTGNTLNPSVSVTTTVNGDVIVGVLGDGAAMAPSAQTGINLNRTDNGAYSDSNQYYLQATAGAWGTGWTVAADDWGLVVAAFKERAQTTLGNGTDPGNSTVAPGSTGNYLDQFTFVTSAGTDSITALTVTTANPTAIASIQIWNEAMTTQYFTTVSSQTGGNWDFSGGTAIPVSTSSGSFRVVFTAQSHVFLASGTYAITGTVTSYTCTNAKTGTDTDSATITVDNSPPSNATWGTIIAGNQQIELNWTNPGDSDFNKVLILRKAGSAVGDTPTEGTEYAVNYTFGGGSIVRYVGNLQTFTDTGLTNGTNYYYKIFAYDTYINYASGLGTGPYTPVLTLSISVSPTSWGVGTVDAGTVQVSTSGTKIGVTNNGNVSETFTLQIFDEDNRDEWIHSSLEGDAGNNKYVLSGIFCATGDSPTDTNFNEGASEDVIIFPTSQTATAAKFAYVGGTQNGTSVAVNGERSLWLRLDMPSTVSGTNAYNEHIITVRIGCQQP